MILMKQVLFVCVHNAGRSQMAAAFAQKHGERRIIALSGGTHPAEHIHPIVIEAMAEKGFDISQTIPQQITVDELRAADQVVVMGCGAESFCPAPLLDKGLNWDLEDSKDQPIEKVREIRDEIEQRVSRLIEELAPIEH